MFHNWCALFLVQCWSSVFAFRKVGILQLNHVWLSVPLHEFNWLAWHRYKNLGQMLFLPKLSIHRDESGACPKHCSKRRLLEANAGICLSGNIENDHI